MLRFFFGSDFELLQTEVTKRGNLNSARIGFGHFGRQMVNILGVFEP